ncbi:hypothetical protein [Arsenicicoccus piscis]|nr:hypothetical protein [Arsenicicoccus piscis]
MVTVKLEPLTDATVAHRSEVPAGATVTAAAVKPVADRSVPFAGRAETHDPTFTSASEPVAALVMVAVLAMVRVRVPSRSLIVTVEPSTVAMVP